MSSSDDWKTTIKNLPAVDEHGEDYAYYVKEDAISGYTSSYRNNGTSTGTIHIINTKEKPKALPSTGGHGTKLLYVLGGLLMCIGVILVMIKRRVVKP